MNFRVTWNIFIPSIMTVVVPSPTSSSCVLLNSIMLFAAGCATSISRRIAWPSLVRTMPPIGSRSILSIAFGPRHDRMMSATLCMMRFGPASIVELPCLRLRRCNVGDLSLPTNLPSAILCIDYHHRCLHLEWGGRLAASVLRRGGSLNSEFRSNTRLGAFE